MHRWITGLVLLLAPVTAFAAPPFLETGFGSPAVGLRLAVTVDPRGVSAVFRLENIGRKPITFDEEYSCSGPSAFSISMGSTADALDSHYGYEPRVKGLSRKLETRCTVNVPIRRRTVLPGKTVTVTVPFAVKGEIVASKETVFRATASLVIEGRSGLVTLHSAICTRHPRPRS